MDVAYHGPCVITTPPPPTTTTTEAKTTAYVVDVTDVVSRIKLMKVNLAMFSSFLFARYGGIMFNFIVYQIDRFPINETITVLDWVTR